MVTTSGLLGPRYFIHISPHGDPDSGEKLVLKAAPARGTSARSSMPDFRSWCGSASAGRTIL